MSYESFLLIVRRKWGSLLLAGLLAGSLAFFALVFFSKHFKVTTDFLVVQTGTSQSQDFYAMLKSSEYLGKVLSQSVGSEKFIGAVVETGGVDGNFLPGNPKDRLEAWEKMVKVSNNPDVGSLHIEVYGNDDRQTLRVAQAVGQVLTEKNMLFRSGDEKSVEIRTLSGPIVEKNPDMERMILSAIAGGMFGISAFLLFALLRAEAKSRELLFASEFEKLAETVPSRDQAPLETSSESSSKEAPSTDDPKSATERIYSDGRLAFEEK